MWHVWEREELRTGPWCEVLRETAHLGDPGVEETMITEWLFKKWDVGACWDRAGSG